MKVVAWSRSLDESKAEALGVKKMANVVELCAAADVVTVHCTYNEKTRGLISADAIARLKRGAIVINTSRAELIDSRALEKAIEENGIRVGLDVYEKEPAGGTGAFEDPIVQRKGVYGTHHVGASTEQAQSAVADETVRIIRTFLEGGALSSVVNIATGSKAACQLVVRHYDRVGVLAEVLGAIRRHEINVEEMENTIFEGAQAASAKIKLSQRPSPELVAELARGKEVIHVEVV
jgi:D-3-phosphoglycerate dehydrogenase